MILLYVNFVAVMLEFDLDNTNWTSGFLSFFLSSSSSSSLFFYFLVCISFFGKCPVEN